MGGAVSESIDPKRQRMREGSWTAVDERERNLAIEDRVAHRVRGRADADARGGDGLRLRADADDRHLRVARLGSPLDLGPVLLRGAPARLRRREPEHLVGGVEPQQDLPPRHALGLVAPDEGRGDDLGREERLVEGIGDLEAAGGLARKRERRRRLGIASAGGEGQRRGEQERGPPGPMPRGFRGDRGGIRRGKRKSERGLPGRHVQRPRAARPGDYSHFEIDRPRPSA